METIDFVPMEAELSPGSLEEWLSTVKDGNKCDKGKRRMDLSIKVKKHLSALGWVFSYFYKGEKRALRYKSPKGRWYYSLATACMSCLNKETQQQQQQQTVPNCDLSCSPNNLSSESCFDVSNQGHKVEDFDINNTAPDKENHSSDDLIKIVLNIDESNLQQEKKIVEDCDTAAFLSVDVVNQQQQQQTIPNYDLSCSPKDISSESSFDVSNQEQKQEKKRCRVEDFDISSTAPEKENHSSDDFIKIVPNFDESDQQQKKKIVEDCDTAAFNVEQEKIRTILSVDLLNQHHQQTIPSYDLSCSPKDLSSESSFDVSNQEQKLTKKRCRVEDFDINSTAPEKEKHSDDSFRIVPVIGEANQQQKKKVVEDCDMAAFNVDQEKNRTVLSVVLNQQQQPIPNNDLSFSPKNLSSESSFDVSNQEQKQKNKRCRVEDFNINSTAPEKEYHSSDDLIEILPYFDESNQQQKIKIMNRVEDCDTAALNVNQEKISIVLNVDVLNQQQKKRKKRTREEIRRPRIRKSPSNILQVMEKNQQKNKRKNQQRNKREKESLRYCRKDPDMNCDVCCVCHLGGKLLLCDGCPSAFHLTCLGFSSLPEEDLWFCPCCCCDWCGLMESPTNSKLMTCEQCQKRFHLNCLDEELCIVSCRRWFCSSQCDRVFSALQNLLGCKIAVGDDGDLVWRLIRAPNEDEHYDDEQISKLESVVEILHQGFEPTEDLFSGRDLVEELIFKRDGNGVSWGCYMVLIERKNEPVMVAAMRVDKDVAEVPLVASLSNYRSSGMCRVLMDELEKQMSQMGVCRLVLPAAEESVTTWTQQFGFSVMESSERLELVKHGMLDFVGTVMCHKFLLKERK